MLDFHLYSSDSEEQNIQNSSDKPFINHEECSDDRPSKSDSMPGIDTTNTWDFVSVPHLAEEQKKQDTPQQEPPHDSAVLPPEYSAPKPEENKEGGDGGNGKRFDEIQSMLNTLFDKVEAFQTTVDKQQEIIKKQKRELERYQSDVIAKMKEPILLDLIEVMDAIDTAFDEADKNPKQYDMLYSGMDGVRKLMKATLENYRVFQIDDSMQEPTKVSRRQQVVDSRTSSDPEQFEIGGQQVNVFYERERIGYVMETENVDGEPREIILRPEDIVRVTYRNNPEHNF